MGLFDRLFGKKEGLKSASSSEEVTGSTEVKLSRSLQLANDKEAPDMELITKSSKRGLQPLINLFRPSLKKSRQRNLL